MNYFKRLWTPVLVAALVLIAASGVFAGETYGNYTVKQGDTVYKIAKAHGISMDAIVNANGLSGNGTMIYPNTNLLLDGNAKNTANANYTVASGESLYSIAKKSGISVTQLKEKNGLYADRIYTGQRLIVSGVSTTTTPDTTTETEDKNDSIGNLTSEEIYMMAKMIYGEARGESYQGQVAVGAVIMNRIKSDLFPNTMAGVLFQKHQFTAVSDGQYYMTPNETALNAARDAAKGVDPTGGALFYWNPVKAPNNAFLNAKPIIVKIGEHVYAK